MNNAVLDKSYHFSIRIVKLYKYLHDTKKEYTMSRQLLRCGTSIGANIAEAQQAQSRADFVSKLNIALKESAETDYWLHLFYDTGYLTKMQFTSIIADCKEIEHLLISIVKSIKE